MKRRFAFMFWKPVGMNKRTIETGGNEKRTTPIYGIDWSHPVESIEAITA